MILLALALPMEQGRAEESLCAEVKIEIQQELTLERQAFDAHMRINNGLETIRLENVDVDVSFADEQGNSVRATSNPNDTDAAFFIRLGSLNGISDVSGRGTVAASSSADIHWLIISAPGTGGEVPSGTLYTVGATLSYAMGGEQHTIEVTPDYIFVKPMPMLTLDYFLTEEVNADDSFTPQIEPPEPFTLGVRVHNGGFGPAEKLKISSAQPKIVENEQGLLIGFEIIGSTINGEPSPETLLVDFGDIPAQESSVARWEMTATLSGTFVAFEASFTHADELGGELTSLIDATSAHLLLRDVRVDLPGRDDIRDFLASDEGLLRVYESSGVDTIVFDKSQSAGLNPAPGDPGSSTYNLHFAGGDGFAYVKVADPGNGGLQITEVRRSDGKRIPVENTWLSRTRREGVGDWDYYFNLFDVSSTGNYRVILGERPDISQPPVFQFIPDRFVAAQSRLSFLVQASDPNGTIPALSATQLPDGATFLDKGDGYGVFDWVPDIEQVGYHLVRFAASDGFAETAETPRIRVCPPADTDCDGMDDSWELAHFGDLSRDGLGDYDEDGILDIDEFLEGSDPAEFFRHHDIPLKAGYNLIAYPYGVTPLHATCSGLMSAMGGVTEVIRLARLNPLTQQYERCNPAEGIDFVIQTGRGYAIELNSEQVLSVKAVPACPEIRLDPGDNLVGHPGPGEGLSCFEWLEAEGPEDLNTIRRLNEQGRYESCTFVQIDDSSIPTGIDFPIRSGEGYFLRSIAGGTLSLPGCTRF
ncbi:MAG: hypothetical protein GY703_21640 [Gammaproteobacteria bacterium]|nr:hypothetical protein [Gammaproteobacteria bacterium]